MFKLIQYSLKIFIALFLVGTVVVIGVITLVDPNQFKSAIQNQITKATGQALTIHGPLSWHIAPTLALEAHDLSLEMPSLLSNNALTLKKIRFVPKLWSLLSGKLLVNLHLEGLKANVTRSIAGHSLLESMQKMLIFSITQKFRFFLVLPYDITVENATLHWKDAVANQDLRFKNITALVKNVSLGAVGINARLNINFELEDSKLDHTGNFSFKGAGAFNHKTQQLDIQDLECSINFPTFPFNTVLATLHIQRLQNTPLIEGNFHIPNLSLQDGLSNFNLPFYPISAKTADLKGAFIYQAPMLTIPSFNLAVENEASITGSFKTELNSSTLKTLSLAGTFEGKNLRIGTLLIPEIKTTLQAKEGIFIFDQIKAQLASSHHQANMQIDIRGDIPQFSIFDQMDSFEINELLARLGVKDKLYGNIKSTVQLTTQGDSPNAWLQHLSGKAYLHLTDGRVRGIDLSPLLRHAQSTIVMLKDTLLKNTVNVGAILTAELGEWRLQSMNADLLVTPFRHLETNITFDNGKAYTADFKLIHPEYIVNGHGMVDLVQRNVESQALALLIHPKQHPSEPLSLFLKETPLPIQIKGSFGSLAIQPNLAHYADSAINLLHKAPAEKAADHTLEKLFGFP